MARLARLRAPGRQHQMIFSLQVERTTAPACTSCEIDITLRLSIVLSVRIRAPPRPALTNTFMPVTTLFDGLILWASQIARTMSPHTPSVAQGQWPVH